MLSVIFPVFIFLGNVNKVYSPTDHIHCEWFCTITAKSPLTAYKMEMWFNVSERIDQKCVANTLYRSLQNTTNTLYRGLQNTSTTGYVFVFLSRKERDYHDGFSFMLFNTMTALENIFQTEQMNETAMKNVSCLLQPMSNQTKMAVSNGLDALNSLRFYISFDNQSRNILFVGYVHLEGNYHISAGFSNGNVSEDCELALASVHNVFSRLVHILYIIYFPLCLTFFCHTLKKKKRTNHRGREPEEGNDHANTGTTREAREQQEGPIPAEEDILVRLWAQRNDSSSMNLANESGAPFHRPLEGHSPGPSEGRDQYEEIDTAAAFQRDTGFATESQIMVDGGGDSGGDGADDDDDDDDDDGDDDDDVIYMIDVDEPASPVGIRSFFSNIVFLNKEKGKFKKFCYCMFKSVIVIIFPLSVLLWIDVFVLGVPRLLFEGITNLPSPYLTKLVFTTCEKHLGLFRCVGLFGCAVAFVFRMLLVCFKPSSKVPGIPDNIQLLFESFGWENFTRDWEYCFKILEEDLSFVSKAILFLFYSSMVIIFIIGDFIISLPIVSFCYGGCWYTVNIFENKLAKRSVLFLEFVWICISITWVTSISYGCSLSLQMAIKSLYISGLMYPIETFSSVAIYLITWHSIWTLYSSFTKIYFDLLTKLFDICSEHHRNEMKDYMTGCKMYIPKDLFDSACNNFEPVTDNLKKLGWRLLLHTTCLFFFFSIIYGTKYPKKVVLPTTLTFFIVFHPLSLDFLRKRDEEKAPKNSGMKEKLKNLANTYFKRKID